MTKKKKLTAGEQRLAGVRQALAFARGEKDHGCVVHTPEEIAARSPQEARTAAFVFSLPFPPFQFFTVLQA